MNMYKIKLLLRKKSMVEFLVSLLIVVSVPLHVLAWSDSIYNEVQIYDHIFLRWVTGYLSASASDGTMNAYATTGGEVAHYDTIVRCSVLVSDGVIREVDGGWEEGVPYLSFYVWGNISAFRGPDDVYATSFHAYEFKRGGQSWSEWLDLPI